ncbi:TIGR04197 family type VII secretion effector [Enterococcus sp. LJL128]|uniref:TIGR04197 family type VII secretion effector n=1 Tax=Enterococcus sp. LJL51 TaxID=3416656 RepID=UPI003CF09537
METVFSNAAVAGQLATGISEGVQGISQSRMITKDTRTTVTGNGAAHTAIDELTTLTLADRK